MPHLINDPEQDAMEIIPGEVIVALGMLYISNLMALVFIHEEAHCISHRFRIVGVNVAVHVKDYRTIAYLR